MLSKTMNLGRSPAALSSDFKMCQVVMAENLLFAVSPANAFNHRIVIESIRQDKAIWHQPRDCRNTGVIRKIA
jgi:uncharacterized protein involved in outer membrane biogenesis